MNLYEVKAKCGHVGRGNYICKTFAIKAENGKMAALKARSIPRVKHDQKDAIISVMRISEQEYNEIILLNSKDPYFVCTNIQEQRSLSIEDEIMHETIVDFVEEVENNRNYYCGKTKIRKVKKYMNHYYMSNEVAQ